MASDKQEKNIIHEDDDDDDDEDDDDYKPEYDNLDSGKLLLEN